MARQFGIQLVNPILHVFHCMKQTVINRTLCSWPIFQMPLCQEGTGPELGSVSLHCKMYWFLLTPSCCWAAKTSQHLAVPQVAFLVAQWQLLHGWLPSLPGLSSAETHRGETLQTLVIPTGHLGACCSWYEAHRALHPSLGSLEAVKSHGAAGGFGQRCPLGSITGEGCSRAGAGAGQGTSWGELVCFPGVELHILLIEGLGG